MSGFLANGAWQRGWYDTRASGGDFQRPMAGFRDRVPAGAFRAEPGRYSLYVSLACPWAHRTLIMRALSGLEAAVPLSVTDPVMDDEGWAFADGGPDTANGFRHLHEAYTATRRHYSGRVSVPALWDSQARVIVNNESSDIMRMLDEHRSYYPAELAERIDAMNAFVYENVNNGVYRCGFATTQAAYERAFARLFNALDRLEAILGETRYLVGERLTEADWRLFTTLVRFDAVYYGHFKCNRNQLAEFRHLSRYLRELFHVPGIAGTVNLEHIKRHYYMSHPHINPTRIVPLGPALDFNS